MNGYFFFFRVYANAEVIGRWLYQQTGAPPAGNKKPYLAFKDLLSQDLFINKLTENFSQRCKAFEAYSIKPSI